MRATLLAHVRELLTRAGYYLNAEDALRPLSFDVVARRDGELLLLKVLTNVDGLPEPVAQELRTIARFLDAIPLVVGERSSSRALENGAVYLRHGVSIITRDTLSDYLVEGVEPLVYAAPGGFYVNMDGARLRELREARGISLGDLAQAAGVSRRAIGMYEEGMGAMVEVAARLEEFLDEPLARPYNPFHVQAAKPEVVEAPQSFAPTFEGHMLSAMREMGFRVAHTTRSPFAAITKQRAEGAVSEGASPSKVAAERVVLAGFGAASPDLAKRAAATANLAEVTETFGVFFVERTTTRVAIAGTPVVSGEEMKDLDEPADLIGLLRERKGRQR